VRDKLDETGITDGAKVVGGYAYATGAAGVSMLNARIEENENLAYAKATAAKKASEAASYVSGFFGWGSSAAAAQQPEEAKHDAGEEIT